MVILKVTSFLERYKKDMGMTSRITPKTHMLNLPKLLGSETVGWAQGVHPLAKTRPNPTHPP